MPHVAQNVGPGWQLVLDKLAATTAASQEPRFGMRAAAGGANRAGDRLGA